MTAWRPVTRICPRCGFAGTYRSPALAEHFLARHSCTRHRRRVAATAARTVSEPRRDCEHSDRAHRHGTRTAYVRDRCRCPDCRGANATASRNRNRDLTYGRWDPWVDAAAIRTHIHALAEAGIGRVQLARLSGVSARHLSAIVNGRGGRVQARLRRETAQRILAVAAEDTNRAPNRKVDGTGTRRRLRALVALGWPQAWLADMLHRHPTNLRRAVYSDLVTARTAADVDTLYNRLWDTRPPRDTPRQRRAVSDALALAARRGWLTPLAWDDPDHDPEPPAHSADEGDEIDEIAIERALTSRSIRFKNLRPHEQAEVVRRFTANGASIRDIAEHLDTSTRTVSRRRRTSAA